MSGDQVNRLLGVELDPTRKRNKGYQPRKSRQPAPAVQPPLVIEVEQVEQYRQERLRREAQQLEHVVGDARKLAAMTALVLDVELSHAVARAGLVMWALADSAGIYRGTARQVCAALGVGKSAGSDAVDRLTRTGYVTRRPDGAYQLLGASSEVVVSGSPGRPGHPDKSTGSPGKSVRVTRTPRPLKGSRGNRASSRAGASPSPTRHPADRPAYEHPTSCTCDGTGWIEAPDQPGRLMRCEVPSV